MAQYYVLRFLVEWGFQTFVIPVCWLQHYTVSQIHGMCNRDYLVYRQNHPNIHWVICWHGFMFNSYEVFQARICNRNCLVTLIDELYCKLDKGMWSCQFCFISSILSAKLSYWAASQPWDWGLYCVMVSWVLSGVGGFSEFGSGGFLLSLWPMTCTWSTCSVTNDKTEAFQVIRRVVWMMMLTIKCKCSTNYHFSLFF